MLFLILSLSSNGSISFYVISVSSCEPCLERVAAARELYPEGEFVTYDIAGAGM